MSRHNLNPFRDHTVLFCGAICTLGFGAFAGWAGLAPLDEGVTAGGAVVVEDRRQVVQHLEGGVITNLSVSEGDHVRRGQTLVVLSNAASGADRDQLLSQLGHFEATTARLTALREELPAIDFSRLSALGLSASIAEEIAARETDLFQQARDGLEAEISILTARKASANATAQARGKQLISSRRGLEATQRQLVSARDQLTKRMIRIDQVEMLERSAADLESELARLESERLEATASAADHAGQIEKRRIEWQQAIAGELVTASAELNSRRQALGAAEDVLARTVITAPMDGEVLNLSVATVGGVVRPGETMMEIVPDSSGMIAAVRIPPNERASVQIGQSVRTQLVAYKGWQAPRLTGQVVGVSADLKVDPATNTSYYEARILIPGEETSKLGEARSLPGMPVQAFIFSGVRRTLFEQIGEPIFESWFRGMRQS
ncbi:MAG TPA: HlyD family type I secretion periplasmic adaptor subunit [Hyphomonadaceae bacterium]|nr:HlyD family type I secretion periplasmic adaptor subunit [Hyphomonadaceae bacterium]HPN06827.1 HlyD family type I secretion periplasmic adaptor subunit [Hyphomonadaceae bacterium]